MMLARFLDYPGAWADLAASEKTTSEIENCLSCPFPIILDVGYAKGAGASYWQMQVDDITSIRRVIAAYFASRSELKAVSIKFADSEFLDQIGVRYRKSPGGSPDKELASTAHFDITTKNLGQAYNLARHMAPSSIKRSIPEVADCVCQAVLDGRFEWGAVDPKMARQIAHIGRLIPAISNDMPSKPETPAASTSCG